MKRTLLVASVVVSLATVAAFGQTSSTRPFVGGKGLEASPSTAPAKSQPAMDQEHTATAQKLVKGGVGFLIANRDRDGGWSLGNGAFKPAATAMALKALIQSGYKVSDPIIKKGFAILVSYQQKDGGIYEPREGMNNYTTAVAVMAFAAAKEPAHKEQMDKAVKYLRGLQVEPGSESPDGKVVQEGDPQIGAVNYGKTGKGDLSNVGMWVEAMKDAGVKGDDPAMQRAVNWITSIQASTEVNKNKLAADGPNDGGFPYSQVESKAGAAGPEGKGLRSYGSMTYVGFKSLLYAGVDKTDPRVKAAYGWIRRYWTLESNPNMPGAQSLQGLYYYYHAYAKALRAWGEDEITDLDGKKHNWRQELIDVLAKAQKKDGSWSNPADRWEEGSPVLVTCYAVMALEETLKK